MAMDDLAGRRLGSYELQGILGKGSWGTVYRAAHLLLGPRAVKVLPPPMAANAQFVKRFQREANLAAGLRHPNIVQIHDIGEAEGLHYIAMELVDGLSLCDLLEAEGRLPLER